MYFEDFCREVIHIRKKKMFKEVNKRKIEADKKQKAIDEMKKKTVVSRMPLRRLRSEIPGLDHIKRRANSIIIKTPIRFEKEKVVEQKPEEKEQEVIEVKSKVKSYHPIINPVVVAPK
mmetsp:Transcript_4112/g.5021  ORF Transcript_4112/g.5021 Transcript_4112/m.5021 type:complete len:118 (-) Transcript_4112:64-417(-)